MTIFNYKGTPNGTIGVESFEFLPPNIFVSVDIAEYGEVFRFDDPVWTLIGQPSKRPYKLLTFGGELYTGTYGNSNGDARVYKYSVGFNSWSQIGGNLSTNKRVYSMIEFDGTIYVGTNPSGIVYCLDEGVWTSVGRLGTEVSVVSLAVVDGILYGAGHQGTVFKYEGGATWTAISSMFVGARLANFDDELYGVYGGLSVATRVKKYSGSGIVWTQIGGDLEEPWNSIPLIVTYYDKLYVSVSGIFNRVYRFDNPNWVYVPDLTWTQKTELGGTGRFDVAVTAGSKVYAGLGNDSISFKSWWEYNPATDTWIQKTDFGGLGRNKAIVAAVGTKVYVGTGLAEGGVPSLDDWWEYDTVANIWTPKADFDGGTRYYAVATALGTKIYVGLGVHLGSQMRDWWEYDTDLDIWTQKADFSEVRFAAVAVSIGSKIYVGLGNGSYEGIYGPCKDWYEYDLALDTWTRKADFGGTARQNAVAVVLGTKIYVGLGEVIGEDGKDWWEYDPDSDTWTQKADFDGTNLSVAATVGTKIYIGQKTDWWEYNVLNTHSLEVANNVLWAGLGDGYEDGGIWSYEGSPEPVGPTNEELMRHMKWFHNGVFQGCWLGQSGGGT